VLTIRRGQVWADDIALGRTQSNVRPEKRESGSISAARICKRIPRRLVGIDPFPELDPDFVEALTTSG
jgi:hypothetical protein